MDRIQMTAKLKEKLPAKRFEHSIGVEYTAGTMAFMYGVDYEKALIAGLLHDCAKYVPNDKKIQKCKKRGISVSECEYHNPELLHAKLSAIYAKEKYGVTDEEILSAIECHTTGKPEMSALDKIIYIADYIEPMRNKAPNLSRVRETAFRDLDECMYEILRDMIVYLEENPKDLDKTSLGAFEYYTDLHIKRNKEVKTDGK